MTIISSVISKIIENVVLIYQRERCIHILCTPFLILYDYNFECNTENYRKYGSHVATGTVYTHSVYTVPVFYLTMTSSVIPIITENMVLM